MRLSKLPPSWDCMYVIRILSYHESVILMIFNVCMVFCFVERMYPYFINCSFFWLLRLFLIFGLIKITL